MQKSNTDRMPLEGVRVIDFCWVWAGPSATELLAFLGAEVIKVESWQQMDSMRRHVDPATGQPADPNKQAGFNCLNLGKLGITVNLSQPRGIDLIKKLVKVSDVAVNNFSAGVLDRLGLGYEALKECRPDIILLSMSGFGNGGPLTRYRGYDPTFQALAGIFDMTGYSDGAPSRSALGGVMDIGNGMMGVFGVLSALTHRDRTGEGQNIDLAQWEVASFLIGDIFLDHAMNHRVPPRQGNRDAVMAPHNCYPCQGQDKWVSIAIATDEEWRAFSKALGHPQWAQEKRFADAFSRWNHQEEMDRLIAEWTKQHTHYEVMHILQQAGVAAMPSFNQAELVSAPHVKERGWFTEVEHPEAGKMLQMSPPLRLSATPARIPRHAPLVGEHNYYIFCELLGLSAEEFAGLVGEQVIY